MCVLDFPGTCLGHHLQLNGKEAAGAKEQVRVIARGCRALLSSAPAPDGTLPQCPHQRGEDCTGFPLLGSFRLRGFVILGSDTLASLFLLRNFID